MLLLGLNQIWKGKPMEDNTESTNFAESLKAALSAEMGKAEKAPEVKEEKKNGRCC
jgi:hypothetical protein